MQLKLPFDFFFNFIEFHMIPGIDDILSQKLFNFIF